MLESENFKMVTVGTGRDMSLQ